MYRISKITSFYGLIAMFAGCSASEHTDKGQSCIYSEIEHDVLPASWQWRSLDMVFVIDKTLSTHVGDRIEAAVRGLIEGDQDGDSVQDRYAFDSVRVAVIRPDSSEVLHGHFGVQDDSCSQIEIAHASYYWYPYGYGDDPDRFINDLSCLLVLEPEECGVKPDRSDEPFGTRGVWIIVTTDRDACEILPNDQATTNKRCEDEELARLFKTYSPGICAGIDVVAGVPAELINDTKNLTSEQKEQYYQTILDDPRMQWSSGAKPISSSCTVSETTVATPPRTLVENIKSMDYLYLHSICSDDYLRIFDSLYTPHSADLVYQCLFIGLRVESDLSAPCFIEETLPETGPITHCEQLAAFGREPDPVRIEKGRETCRMRQRIARNGVEPLEYGCYFRNFEDFGYPFEGQKKYRGSFDEWLDREATWQTKGGFHPPNVGLHQTKETVLCEGTVKTTRQTPWVPGSTVVIGCMVNSCSPDGGYVSPK